MRFLILGGTGLTGIELIRQLAHKYPDSTILIYARSPQKVPDDLKNSKAVTIIQGGLGEHDKLLGALKGVDIVISALGPAVMKGPLHPWGTPLAKAYKSVIDLMHQQGVKRLICLGTASIKDPNDKFNVAFSILVTGIATLATTAYRDIVAIGDTVRSDGADLDWTIVRVPVLTTNENKDVIAGYIGDGKTSTFLSRAGFGAFIADEVEKREWVKKAPLLCSAGCA